MAVSNREQAARGGWGLGAVAGVSDPPYAIDGVRGGTYPRADALTVVGTVALPFEQVDTARASTPANPQPAASQVWLVEWPEAQVYTLRGPIGTKGTAWASDEYPGGVIESGALTDGKYGVRARCIGVATPHGRVMVGDTFGNGHITVLSIPCDDQVRVQHTPGGALEPATYSMDAHALARGQEGTRTLYAPARVGERYLHRLHKVVVVIPAMPSIMCLGNAMWGEEVRVHLCAGALMPVAEWERLDPSTASHAVALVPREPTPTLASIHADFCSRDLGPVESLALPKRGEVTVFLPSPPRDAHERIASLEQYWKQRVSASTMFSVRTGERAIVPKDEPHTLAKGLAPRTTFTPKLRMAVTGLDAVAKAAYETARAFTRIHDALPKPTPADAARAHRDEVRRAIDKAIAADKGQPFAHARAAALHAWAETLYSRDTVADVAAVHAGLLRYEALRGSRREPSLAALDVGVPETARAMYERERAAVRVEAVTPREEPARPTGGASLNGWQTQAHFWERWTR